MSNRHEQRRLQRVTLNVSQALKAARVIRSDDNLFGDNPFYAMGVGHLLAALLVEMDPAFTQEAGWANRLYPEFGAPSYGPVVAFELDRVMGMAFSERNIDETGKALAQATNWGKAVAAGNGEASYLEDIALELGRTLTDSFMKGGDPSRLPQDKVGDRMVEIFERGVTLRGGTFQEAEKRDLTYARIGAFAELAAVSAAAHLYRTGKTEFEYIGHWSTVRDLIRPQSYAGFFLQSWLSQERTEQPLVGAVAVLSCLNHAWGTQILPDFQVLARTIDMLAQAFAATLGANPQQAANSDLLRAVPVPVAEEEVPAAS